MSEIKLTKLAYTCISNRYNIFDVYGVKSPPTTCLLKVYGVLHAYKSLGREVTTPTCL